MSPRQSGPLIPNLPVHSVYMGYFERYVLDAHVSYFRFASSVYRSKHEQIRRFNHNWEQIHNMHLRPNI
jgi:hypothetical protein